MSYQSMLLRPQLDPGQRCVARFLHVNPKRAFDATRRFMLDQPGCFFAAGRPVPLREIRPCDHADGGQLRRASSRTDCNQTPGSRAAATTSLGSVPASTATNRLSDDDGQANAAAVDPYAPQGVRAGAFLVKPAIEIRSGYDSNPARIRNGRGSAMIVVAPELEVKSQLEKHELSAAIRGSYTDTPAVPGSNVSTVDARISGRYDLNEVTAVRGEARYNLDTDTVQAAATPAAGINRLKVSTPGATVGIEERVDNVVLSAEASAEHDKFLGSRLVDGQAVSNRDIDYAQYGARTRVGYVFTPQFTLFVDMAADRRIHDLTTDVNGFRRDSTGTTVLAGASLAFPDWLAGEIAVGQRMRSYADPMLQKVAGYVVDASLSFTPTKRTTIQLTTTSDVTESTLADVSGVLRRDGLVQVSHQLDPQLTAIVGTGYGWDNSIGGARVDSRYFVNAGLVYKVSRVLQLKSEVRQDWLRSNVPNASVSATTATVGIRAQY